jgi:hypothetical protein
MDSYQQSSLWKKCLAQQQGDDPYGVARDRLRLAFIQTRAAVKPLVNEIAKELPDLTVHDITHLDSLWGIADTLMGDDFEINPAETFVLGMAFLLHDAACSTFAYPNGIDGLSDTTEWKDFVAQKGFSEEELKKGTLNYQQALFETLRLLHPQQAGKLLAQSWLDLNGVPRWLMEDVELRNHYGRDIGKIASSHGKDAAIAEQEWANLAPLTPHSSLGLGLNDWKIDRLKIAMLLRCIDAAHIDSKRAPDMLGCLTQPSGESKEHWLFQNHLGAVGINGQNELYWSGQPFAEKDADAWWRCYSAAQMIDREIRIANCILKNNNRKEFRAKGVAGAQDLSVFQKNVPAQGWSPVDIGFQISQIGDVVEKFGGAKLYGNKPYLALRELIQNAADAIRARRIYRIKPEHGRIDISLTEENGAWWLHVQDDGIGMSRYVLTEVLLDFGRSLWRDAALREQWKGLAGKNFEAVGQFGIGFFSVFMLGDEVRVTTWRDGDAELNQATLHLRHCTNAKPILLETPVEQRLSEFGTRVSVRLKNGRASLLQKYHAGGVKNNFFSNVAPTDEITLSQTVGILAPALDINVWCKDGIDEKTQTIVANDWRNLPPMELLKRLSPLHSEEDLLHCVEGFHNIVEDDGTIVGRVSLAGSPHGGFGIDLGVLVHKGIVMGRWARSGILLSSNNVDLARSLAHPICSEGALGTWAHAIYDHMNTKMSCWISNVLLSLGHPADGLPVAEMANEYVTPEKIVEHLQQNELEEIVLVMEAPSCPNSMSQEDFDDQFELLETVVDSYLSRFGREVFGLEDWIGTLLPETDNLPRSVGSAIQQSILKIWPGATWKVEETIVGKAGLEKIKAKCLVFRKAI